LHKLAEAGHLKRALFVCDRNELRKQGFGQMFSVFGDNAAFVENKDPKKNARIIVSTYQALGIDEDGDISFFLQNYPRNYFSHIIIDECHMSTIEYSFSIEEYFFLPDFLLLCGHSPYRL
jgi:type I restriction enzyme R subunit